MKKHDWSCLIALNGEERGMGRAICSLCRLSGNLFPSGTRKEDMEAFHASVSEIESQVPNCGGQDPNQGLWENILLPALTGN